MKPQRLLLVLLCSFVLPTAHALQKGKKLAPVDAESRLEAVEHGCELLLNRQESLAEGKAHSRDDLPEWPYEGVYRVGGEIPLGYRIGGTSIASMSIVHAPGFNDSKRRAAVERALEFVLTQLDDPLMKPSTEYRYDVRGWGHTYALQFLLTLKSADAVPEKHEEAVEERIVWLIAALQDSEIPGGGGWNYSRGRRAKSSPFMTAPTLQALFEAKAQGYAVDAEVVERGLMSLEAARLDKGSYQYAANPDAQDGEGFEDLPGSTGRMPICETTLLLAGRGSVERVRFAVDSFFEHWEWLEKRRRKDGTHIPPYGIAPYYFFYAHLYAAQAIEQLPEADRPALRAKLYALLEQVREDSGGWNDRVFDRSEGFGTSTTILALLQPDLAAPAAWQGTAAANGSASPAPGTK